MVKQQVATAVQDDDNDEEATPAPYQGGQTVDPNDVLFPGGVPTFKFDTIGDSVEGTIVDMLARQQTDIKTGELKTWKDGSPRMQVVVTLQTDLRDPDIDEDDGRRRIFLKGDMARAVRDAATQAGKRKVALGAFLAVRYERDGEPAQRGLSAPKVYGAIYQPVEVPFPEE